MAVCDANLGTVRGIAVPGGSTRGPRSRIEWLAVSPLRLGHFLCRTVTGFQQNLDSGWKVFIGQLPTRVRGLYLLWSAPSDHVPLLLRRGAFGVPMTVLISSPRMSDRMPRSRPSPLIVLPSRTILSQGYKLTTVIHGATDSLE